MVKFKKKIKVNYLDQWNGDGEEMEMKYYFFLQLEPT